MTFDEQEDVFSEEEKPKKARKIPVELTDEPTPKPQKRGRPKKIKVAPIDEPESFEAPLQEKEGENEQEKPSEEPPKKTWNYPKEGGFIAAPNSATFPWEKCADFGQLCNLINIVWPSENLQATQLKTKALAPFIHNFFNKDGANEPSMLGDAIAAALMLKMADKISSISQEDMDAKIGEARNKR